MHYRLLSAAPVLDGFRQHFWQASGVAIPIEYLQQATVVGAFDGDTLVGGYATALGQSGRWFQQIPSPTLVHDHVERTLELNALWLRPGLHGRAASAEFWMELGRDLGSRDVDYIVFGANMRRSGLARLYEPVACGLLYEGPVRNSSLASARYYYSNPQRFSILQELYVRPLARRVNSRRGAAAAPPADG